MVKTKPSIKPEKRFRYVRITGFRISRAGENPILPIAFFIENTGIDYLSLVIHKSLPLSSFDDTTRWVCTEYCTGIVIHTNPENIKDRDQLVRETIQMLEEHGEQAKILEQLKTREVLNAVG